MDHPRLRYFLSLLLRRSLIASPPMPPRRFLPFFLVLSIAASAFAGSDEGKITTPPVVIQDPLSKGVGEIELLGGFFHSPINTGGTYRPRFDYAGGDFRYGIVLTPSFFDHSRLLRGNVELLVDALTDDVTAGPGHYLAGGSLLFRYNFIQPGSHFIPYFQAGGGGLHSDAAEVPSQRLIGGNFEFILEADLGARIPLNDRWSLLVEAGFQHISNGDTAARNVGVNALGGRIGVGWIY
jgi:lipid A 3-O-deacylase